MRPRPAWPDCRYLLGSFLKNRGGGLVLIVAQEVGNYLRPTKSNNPPVGPTLQSLATTCASVTFLTKKNTLKGKMRNKIRFKRQEERREGTITKAPSQNTSFHRRKLQGLSVNKPADVLDECYEGSKETKSR